MLFDKLDLEDRAPLKEDWGYDAFRQFAAKLSDTTHKFPCIPATVGFKLNHFRYAFLSDPRTENASVELAQILKQFGDQCKHFGKYTSLITFFQTPEDLIQAYTVDQYRNLFWSLLNTVNELDPEEWPSHIPMDPHHHVWEFCYGGEQYFMYCATPAHQLRQSRHFPYFIFAITPRWVLVEFNSAPEAAAQVKSKIRERITAYDNIGIHPDLNLYGSEHNFEWKQYFLSDDTSSSAASRCPFHHLHLKKS
ncbi:YqcI/YcgG family protein [Paenibacillus rigui]|uniref:YqcI/YcgG family protein n=1 Tax=Paenibacillus rigui TaxID=554312 RepID=A0A229UIZ0_9BACL|nr:YqcI/YcgG family protein [Paenibacillus rigui]OXM83427.1 hypothetical protein CF651_25805 [Paenibacillus rigui]